MATSKKLKRTSLRLSDKYEIIKQMDSGVHRKTIMETLNMNQSTISRIKRNKKKIVQHLTDSNIVKKSGYTRMRPAAVMDLDKAL